jgi:hypothetical protein
VRRHSIFGLQNPGVFRDEGSESSVSHRWPDAEASDRRESFDGVGNFMCDFLGPSYLLRAAITRR